MDTIYSLASARGKAGVAVVRISGPQAHDAAHVLAGRKPELRRATLCRLRDEEGIHLDDALVLTFPEGSSFTGEAVAELQLHGALATVDAVLARLSRMAGLRLAEPGEFTRRALENEQLDISQVEGLGDLLEAETEAQRCQALRVLSGAIGETAEQWRAKLVRAAALIAATIDFADEEVPVDVSPEVLELVDAVLVGLRREARGGKAAERIREGFEVAIVGPPNAGKSTLLNALAGREAAITSEIAGTTRDVIEVRMDLNGLPVTILDTAGLRETDDVVESLGIERARKRANRADLRIFLTEGGEPGGDIPLLPNDIVLRSKLDQPDGSVRGVSGKTGHGVTTLVGDITTELEKQATGAGLLIRERHRVAIDTAIQCLETARNQVKAGSEFSELAAEDLTSAVRALDSLVGRVDVENILDEVFKSFCLGK